MRKFSRIIASGAAIVLGTVGLSLVPTAAYAANTTYYIDAVAGSDSAAGTTPGTAWKTLTKVNATTFGAGDQILFHVGQTWSGRLHPLGSGVAGNPITLSSYGGTGYPVIDGGSLPGGGAVYLTDQSYWTIQNLEVVSDSGVNNLGSPNPGTARTGILVDSPYDQVLKGIVIQNNYVHDVNGCFDCADLNGHFNGGIVVGANIYSPVSVAKGGYDGVQILNNLVEDVGRSGIIFIDNSSGIWFWVDQASLSQNITISGNEVYRSDSDGITVGGGNNVQIDHNIVGDAGQETILTSTQPSTAGIWPGKTENVVIEYNEVYGTQTNVIDGQGFDIDLGVSNATVQYNYSHDNEGGFLLLMGGWVDGSNATVRYNLSVNDGNGGGKGVFSFSYGVKPGTNIYNNTVYVAPGLASNIMHCESCDVANAWSFRNNVIANYGTGGYAYPTQNDTIDYNLFYGNHPASEPADAHKLTTDPQFIAPVNVAPYGIGSVAGFQLAGTSPAAGSGLLIAANGGHDYFGRTVSATANPTRGFHEVNTY